MGISAVAFRFAESTDAENVAALHVDSWRRHYRGAYSDAFLDGDVAAERQAVWSSRLAAPNPSAATVLAEIDGQLAGFVHVAFDDDEQWGSLVDNLHVAGDRQRHGIGSALIIRAAQAVADHAAAKSMYLWVLGQNTSAQAFYASHGGTFAERTFVLQPGASSSHLNGNPEKIRCVWPDVHEMLGAARA